MIEQELKTKQYQEIIRQFASDLENENKSVQYVSEHNRSAKEFFLFMEENGVTVLKSINQEHVDSYVTFLETQRLDKRTGELIVETTVAKKKNSIRQLWKYLGVEEYDIANIRLRHKRKQQPEPATVLSHQEIKQLYSICDESPIGYRDRCCIALYYGCGMRRSEGLRLMIPDIDFAKGRILVRKSKNNHERYVVMSPVVQRQIEEYVYSYRDFYLPEGSNNEGLLIGERGQVIKTETLTKRIEALWGRVKDRYGSEKHIGWHTLRHSLGTHLYMAGMSVEMIALMLGHRTLEATQLYIHAANELKR